MIGGAYKKALEVGFTEQQAAYMEHLSSDTKQQALDKFEEFILEEMQEIEEEMDEEGIPWQFHAVLATVLVIGFIAGKLL